LPSPGVDNKVSRHGLDLFGLAIAYPAYALVRQGTLPHAMFEEAATVAGDIKSEVARLSHRACERKGLARGEIVHELCAGSATHGAKGIQLVKKTGIQRRHDLLTAQQ
jgi:hypothetical protein